MSAEILSPSERAERLTGPKHHAPIDHAIDAIGSYPGRALTYAVMTEFPEDTDSTAKLARKIAVLQDRDPEDAYSGRTYRILRDYGERVLEPSGLVITRTHYSPQHRKRVTTGHSADTRWSPFALPVAGAMLDWQLQFPHLDLRVLGDYRPRFNPGMPSTATNIFSSILKSPENYVSLDELSESFNRPRKAIYRILRALETSGIIMRTLELDHRGSDTTPKPTKRLDSYIGYRITPHCQPAIADLALRMRLLKNDSGFRQAAHARLRQILETPADVADLLSQANPHFTQTEKPRPAEIRDIQKRRLGSLTLQCIPIEPRWRDQRMCNDDDLELFFPPGTKGPSAEQAQEAKDLCSMCDARASCLQWSIDTRQRAGIFGAMDPDDRRKYRSKPHAPGVPTTTPRAVTNDELPGILIRKK